LLFSLLLSYHCHTHFTMATNETLGFANLPNQVHRKSVKKGFDFTLMIVGEPGLGKSTLVNCLFRTDLYKDRKAANGGVERAVSKVDVVSQTVDIEERGVRLKLTVVDCPGFGEGLDSSNFQTIVDHVDQQFERYLQHESGLNRRQIVDTRIHACFYFISPVGYTLRPIDVAFMKLLHKKVNIIPLIAKADVLTRQEVVELKKRILRDIESHGISIYTPPECEADEDEDFKEQIRELCDAVPFAISASQDEHDVRGKKVLGRAYPWGVVETENPDHSDFVKLRSLLVTHMQDLREVTQELHYENYRSQRLANQSAAPVSYVLETSLDEESTNMEKDRMLKQKEAELRRMEMLVAQMQQQLQSKTEQSVNEHNSEV